MPGQNAGPAAGTPTPAPAAAPAATAPTPAPNPGNGNGKSDDSNRRRLVIIAAMCAAALAIASGIVVFGMNRRHDTALAACLDAQTTLANAEKTLKESKKAAEAAAKINSDDVSDPKAIDNLKNLTKSNADINNDAVKSNNGCGADLTANILQQHADALNSAATENTDTATKFTNSTQTVYDGQSTKMVSTSRNTLQTSVNDAQNLMTSSNGKVADNATRTNLQKAIDEAKKLLAKYEKDSSWKTSDNATDNNGNAKNAAKEMDKSNSDVKSAMGKVNGSVSAKQASEAKKKAAEDAEKAAAQAAADTNRCSSIAGSYATQAVGVTIQANCSASAQDTGNSLWSGTYVAQSFQDNGGAYTWKLSNGKSLSYYPSGMDAPVSDMDRNYFGADAIRSAQKIVTSDGKYYSRVN
ncbi:hypothetical protein [Bifidobacterium pluvialisilvae]|uniref:hypothetical protein n=1 Tax=Bifidobacterium pluvialisilvae TaxID=2834436 RepID=UPI001F3BFDBD|nr:hypothetical protein [Bifidobacterium pluvialisilvae]